MIATILRNANSFPAIEYNERKVKKGNATLIVMENFGKIGERGNRSVKEMIEFLEEYSSSNDRIRKPQFHLSLSCKGKEMSVEQLLDFAREYLKEMGYGEPGQPLLVYSHNDTANNHIHIITSRIDPNGNKINHDNERRRSQKVLEKLLEDNLKLKAKEDIEKALKFNFRSETQFKAILEAMKYEVYEEEGNIMVKKGGMIQGTISKEKVIDHIKENKEEFIEPNYKRLKGIFYKFRDLNTDINGIREDLHKKFGLELVFFGKKDSPYGYAVIDFKNKKVYEGGKILSIKSLLDFKSPEEYFVRIDEFINKCFEDNPNITTALLNKRLRRLNAMIKKGEIYFGKEKKKLKPFLVESLNINNKIAWIKSFNPRSTNELTLLGRLVGLDKNLLLRIEIDKESPYWPNRISDIKKIFAEKDLQKRKNLIDASGFRLIRHNDRVFAYDSKHRSIIDLQKARLVQPQLQNKRVPDNALSNINIPSINAGKGTGTNREWEVGTKKKWDEVDDGRQIKY